MQIPAELAEDGPEKKITRLAIGTPGGFNLDQQKYIYEDSYEIVILPHFTIIPYPNDQLPKHVCITFLLNVECKCSDS